MTADGIGIVVAIVMSVYGATAFLACFCESALRRFMQLKEEKKPAPKNEADNED